MKAKQKPAGSRRQNEDTVTKKETDRLTEGERERQGILHKQQRCGKRDYKRGKKSNSYFLNVPKAQSVLSTGIVTWTVRLSNVDALLV